MLLALCILQYLLWWVSLSAMLCHFMHYSEMELSRKSVLLLPGLTMHFLQILQAYQLPSHWCEYGDHCWPCIFTRLSLDSS